VSVAERETQVEPYRCWMTTGGKRWRRYEISTIAPAYPRPFSPAIGLSDKASVPYAQLLGTVCAGWLMARQTLTAERRSAENGRDAGFLSAKLATATLPRRAFLGAGARPSARDPRREDRPRF